MSLYKRGNIYWTKFKFKGQLIRQSTGCTSIAKAERYQRKLKEQLEEEFLSGISRTPFVEAMIRFIEEHVHSKKPQTQTRYLKSCKALRRHMEHLYCHAINRRTGADYISKRLAEGCGHTGIRHDLAVLKKMLNLCVDWGYVHANPLAGWRPNLKAPTERVRSLTNEEEEAILSVCPDDFKPIIIFAIETGMREGEILGLRHSYLDLDKQEITLPDTKSNKGRTIPVNDLGWAQIWAQSKYLQSDLVFPLIKRDGTVKKRIVDNNSSRFRRWVLSAKVKDIRFHDLRHTYATRYIKRGGKIERLQKLLGHSTINQTMKYAHVDTEDLRDDIQKIEAARVQKS